MMHDPLADHESAVEVTLLDYCSHLLTHVKSMMRYGHDRLYSVVFAEDGTPSIIWNKMTIEAWHVLSLTNAMLNQLSGNRPNPRA